jgi:hypothetical protein
MAHVAKQSGRGKKTSSKRPKRLWGSSSCLPHTYRRFFPEGKSAGASCLTTHLHLTQRLRISRAIPLLPHTPLCMTGNNTLKCYSFRVSAKHGLSYWNERVLIQGVWRTGWWKNIHTYVTGTDRKICTKYTRYDIRTEFWPRNVAQRSFDRPRRRWKGNITRQEMPAEPITSGAFV